MSTSNVKTDNVDDIPYLFDFLFTPYFLDRMTIETVEVREVPQTITGRGFVRIFKVKVCVVKGVTKDGPLELRLRESYFHLLQVGTSLKVRYQKGRFSGLLRGGIAS